MSLPRVLLISLILLTVISCKKEPGPGGLATVKGKVFGTDVTSSGNVRDSGYVGDYRVYISVSGNSAHFDDARTSYDGSYKFSSLREGSYDVWVFGDCDTCNKVQMFDLKTVTVSGKRETVIAEDLRIIF